MVDKDITSKNVEAYEAVSVFTGTLLDFPGKAGQTSRTRMLLQNLSCYCGAATKTNDTNMPGQRKADTV